MALGYDIIINTNILYVWFGLLSAWLILIYFCAIIENSIEKIVWQMKEDKEI